MCCICKETLREKEPLEDKRLSYSYCDKCLNHTPVGQLVSGEPIWDEEGGEEIED